MTVRRSNPVTLILSQVFWGYALQVSDRLVSDRGMPFNPVANKTVIYLARDGVMVMSYSGTAYLAGRSTDRWIAESLAGAELPEEGIQLGSMTKVQPIGLALKGLQLNLGRALGDARTSPAARKMGFELVGVGWRWGKKHSKPIAAEISKGAGINAQISLVHRRRELRTGVVYLCAPTIHGAFIVPDLLLRLRAARGDPDMSETELVRLIRNRSMQVPNEVGPDCLSVLISPPGYGQIRVRYHGVHEAGIAIVSQTGEITATIDHAAFSPWIIGPNGWAAPSVLAGNMQIGNGGFQISLEAPTSSKGIFSAMGSVVPPSVPPF